MAVSLLKLRPWSCRYPLDEVAQFFCGEPVEPADGEGRRGSYCARHARICYAAVSRSRLGNPNIATAPALGTAMVKAEAAKFAANVLPIILPLRARGASLRDIAGELNARGLETARGGTWAATQVADILRRAEAGG